MINVNGIDIIRFEEHPCEMFNARDYQIMIRFREISIHSQNILSVKLIVPFERLWSLIGLDMTLFGSSSRRNRIIGLDWKRL